MAYHAVKIVFLITLFLHCSPQNTAEDELLLQARELARQMIILDSHIDLPYRLLQKPDDVSVQTATGHFDYPRAIAGGLNIAFTALYIPPEYQEKAGAKALADRQIDMVYELAGKWPDKFQMIVSPREIAEKISPHQVLFALGIENGAAIEQDINNLSYFYERGVRYITLTHGKSNLICDASFDTSRPWQGVSRFGKEVIAEMNRLGMMIDVSHISDQAFYDVLDLSLAPLIASHSACRYFTPEFERNMDDEMIALLARKGGVIQIPFGSFFLKKDIFTAGEQFRKEIEKFIAKNRLSPDDSLVWRFSDSLRAQYARDPGDVSLLVDHIEHVVKLVGVDHVGLGSDFEGVTMLPRNLTDVSYYPHIIRELLIRGYSEADIGKIAAQNFIRVWEEVEKTATK